MANWADISFAATQIDYIARLESLRTRSQAVATEVENARDGQADLLTRIQKCMVLSVGLTQDVNANGYRWRGLPTPLNPDEPATKAFAEGLAFATVLPAQSGNAGGLVTTDGITASWTALQGVTVASVKRAQRRALLSFIK